MISSKENTSYTFFHMLQAEATIMPPHKLDGHKDKKENTYLKDTTFY
jgi:hypothetical protein